MALGSLVEAAPATPNELEVAALRHTDGKEDELERERERRRKTLVSERVPSASSILGSRLIDRRQSVEGAD